MINTGHMESNRNLKFQTGRVVRRLWSEMVPGVPEPSTSVIRTLNAISSEGKQIDDGVVTSVIRRTPEWIAGHREMIYDMYDRVFGELAPIGVVDQLVALNSPAEVASAISEIQSNQEKEKNVEEKRDGKDDEDTDDDDCLSTTETLEESLSRPFVDVPWIETFAESFGREPFVDEYVHIRNRFDVKEAYSKHAQAFLAMRNVYRQFRGVELSERTFVREYVEGIQTTKWEDLAQSAKMESLESIQYREGMMRRLCDVHVDISGERLGDREATFMFEDCVRGSELALDGDLFPVVSKFVSTGIEIRDRIASIYRAYLGRECEPEDETNERVMEFRMHEYAEPELKRHLHDSIEFTAHVANLVEYATENSWNRSKIFASVREFIAKTGDTDFGENGSLVHAIRNFVGESDGEGDGNAVDGAEIAEAA